MIVAFGVNHKIAPIDIREQFYLNPIQQELLLAQLKTDPRIAEVFVLSTCNRVEVYLSVLDSTEVLDLMIHLISKIKKTTFHFDPKPFTYVLKHDAAITHLFRVSCGLESLVLGEKQILGQVKAAVEKARECGTLSTVFNIWTHLVIRAGKMAQHETDISFGGSSISWAAIELAQKEWGGSLQDKKVLIIGAGKMGEIALGQLKSRGVGDIYLMNRTGEKAEALAQEYGGVPVSFFDIKDVLTKVDVCFCCSGAPHYILTKDMMENVVQARNNKFLVMLDISMPRNIDPQVNQLPNVKVKAIDDLQEIVQSSLMKRERAIEDVEQIIRQKILEYKEKLSKIDRVNGSDYFGITASN